MPYDPICPKFAKMADFSAGRAGTCMHVIKGQIVNYDTQRNIKILTDKCKKTYQFKTHCKDDAMISLH